LKIAIVFDSQNRRDTTGVYCRRALQAKHEVKHFLPDQIDQIRAGEHDLFMNIDDGRSYRFRADLHPSVFWAIDTHVKPDRCLERARDFDFVFCAQRQGREEMRRAGIPARWCPLAFDPEIHRKHPLPKILDLSFVGHFGRFRYQRFLWTGKEIFRERGKLISFLKKKFNLFTGNFYFEDMAVVYSISKIVFNRSVKDDVNMRVFEALGCGSLLLTNRIGPGQDLLFKDREHLVEYKTRKHLAHAAEYYLSHDEERERIAEQGRALALKKHTYAHRMDYMLSFLAPRTEQGFDFSRVQAGGDDWRFEQAALAQFCKGLKKGAYLGCGPRKIVSSAIGIDIFKRNSQADLLSSGDQLPFRDGELDYVVASHNLEHYADIQRTLGEWKRVLKIGGILGVVVPDDRIIDTLSLNPEHRQAFSPELLRKEIDCCGGLKMEILQEVVDAWSFGCICRKIS
jgi:SAM-dependent methyltransferase